MPITMNPDVKAKWIALLASGDFKRGVGWLRRETMNVERMCCLGVLCELYRRETGQGEWMLFDEAKHDVFYEATYKFVIGESVASRILPSQVMQWAGLEDVNPRIPHMSPSISSLAELNDRATGDAFDEIIPVIAEHF